MDYILPIKLIIVDPNKPFCEAAMERFSERPEVDVVRGKFESVGHFDCMVTAGNSFGLMDAGVDLAVLKFFGNHIQDEVQRRILEDHLGEQLVGTSIIIPTGKPAHPYVAHSPTMRVPLNISGTDNVYAAMWATFTAIHRHNRDLQPASPESETYAEIAPSSRRPIKTIVCPGLGTGTGGMDVEEAALQIYLAYIHYSSPPRWLNGTVAQERHDQVHYGTRWGFLNPRSDLD